MKKLLLILLASCATEDSGVQDTQPGDPHEVVTEGCLPGRTCEWACSSQADREFIGGSCTAINGHSCAETFYVFGTSFRGCCEITATTAFYRECG